MCRGLEINGFEPAAQCFGAAVESQWIKRVVCVDEKGIVVKIQTAKTLSSV